VDKGTFGGTCLNVGCIPTKMFVHPADVAWEAVQAGRLGVDVRLHGVRWADVRDRVFRRIDPISVAGLHWRERNANVTLFRREARFTGPKRLDTGAGVTITADRFVIAAGSRVAVPEIPGLADLPPAPGLRVGYHTSDTIMRIDALPRRLAIVGGGFVSAEFAHVFGSFGTDVTVVNRSGALLRREDRDVSARFTELARRRWDVRLDAVVRRVEAYDGGIRLHLLEDGRPTTLEVDTLLVATGRVPNSDVLDVEATGVKTDGGGRVVVDEQQRTTAEDIWALGDVSNPHQLKHVANLEARVVHHNLLHPEDPVAADHRFVPSAVFTDPPIASVGLPEQEAEARGVEHLTSRRAYGDVAFGWAMEDTTGFAKLVADPRTGLLLGAHILGPQASTLIQPLVQAMSFGQRALDVARGQYWIHPALSEVVENALLGLGTRPFSTETPG
jgi:mycothione reductase